MTLMISHKNANLLLKLRNITFYNTYVGFPSSAGKESACNTGDLGLIPGLGRCPGKGNDYPLQYSVLENSMDSIVHGVAKSHVGLRNFHLIIHMLHFYILL